MRIERWRSGDWVPAAIVAAQGSTLSYGGERRPWVAVEPDGLTVEGNEVFCPAVAHLGPSSYDIPLVLDAGWYRACRSLGSGCGGPFELVD